MKPSLFYPVSPIKVIQPFGADPAYYAKFLDANGNPQKGHMGIDFQAAHGQSVYAAHDGNALYIKDAHGGEGIWNYGEGFLTISWHLIGNSDTAYKLPIPFDNVSHPVKKGDLIGYADNTGAPYESSGDHLHFGLALTDEHNTILNQDNGYGGCVDPSPYFNGEFAHPIDEAVSETETVVQDIANIKPTDPNAPQEEGLIEEAIEKISEELKDIT